MRTACRTYLSWAFRPETRRRWRPGSDCPAAVYGRLYSMTKTNRVLILCALLSASLAVAAGTNPAQYSVRDFGAAGDGRTKDTAAIQSAIDACAKAGGGTVYLPAGQYLTGAIQLRSHIIFEVGPGAVILGSEDPADYPLRDNAWGGDRKAISSLIYAADVEDVTITGRGTINGQ